MLRIAILLAVPACFQGIGPDLPDAGRATDSGPLGKVTTTPASAGAFTTWIDSTSASEWTNLDLATGREGDVTAWDLRFQRFHISTNGGVSGAAGVEIVPVPDLGFADVTSAPTAGWIADAPDGDDPNADPDYAFEQGVGWYDYNPTTHVVTPKPLVWVVRTRAGTAIKLELLAYYDEAGTAGWFTVHWGPL
ncbi:MAG: HmuY family protein [Kofleriaceae bacterium]